MKKIDNNTKPAEARAAFSGLTLSGITKLLWVAYASLS